MGKTAYVFPGQGSQVVGMAKDFCDNFRDSALVFEEASDAIRVDLKKLCFDGPLSDLTLTPNLQPALFTTEAAMLAAIRANTDDRPVVVAGHSLGEYSALHAAGSLTLSDGVRLTRCRGLAMQEAVPAGRGTMAAILGLTSPVVDALCAKANATFQRAQSARDNPYDVVEPANYNAPGQVVVAGTVNGVAKAVELLKDDPEFKGGKHVPLQVSAPFHCSLMKPAQLEMAPKLAQTSFAPPTCLVIPNTTATPTRAHLEFAGLLTDQITRTVRWEQSMLALRALEITTVYEIGPGKVLAGLHKRIDREMPVKNVSTVALFKEVFQA